MFDNILNPCLCVQTINLYFGGMRSQDPHAPSFAGKDDVTRSRRSGRPYQGCQILLVQHTKT
jgi:hypothetical protein